MSVLTIEQAREQSLAMANETRSRRAELKRDLKAGRRYADEILLDPPEWALNMEIVDVIRAMPRYRRIKALSMLNRCQVSPAKTLGALSDRQRASILARLERGRR